MRLSLVCHASTSALRRAAFPLDEPLDAIGTDKAGALAGQLPAAAQVWASRALRTVQTAAALGLAPQLQAALDDCDYGHWAGQRLADLSDAQGEAIATWLQDPGAAPHGGESVQAVQQRVALWMDGLDDTVDHIVAVTHPAVIRVAILHALGAGLSSFWRLDISPLSITDLRCSRGRWTVRSVGAVPSIS